MRDPENEVEPNPDVQLVVALSALFHLPFFVVRAIEKVKG